ncbi:hypothetical protein HYV88_04670 [Candidatus Woesearchaeota archaeon]|nr:hypothetical protein [Candidatus Woesearchaeota archaeon]
MSLIAIIIHFFTLKFVANKSGALVDFNLWKTKRFGFRPHWISKIAFPTGIIVPLLITIISKGQLFFSSTTSSVFNIKPAYRIGRKYTKLTSFEYAKIASAPLFIHILLAVISKTIPLDIFYDFSLINSIMAISYILPLPGLLGATILLESPPLYIFAAVFVFATAIMLKTIGSFAALILAFIFALSAFFLFMWRKYS